MTGDSFGVFPVVSVSDRGERLVYVFNEDNFEGACGLRFERSRFSGKELLLRARRWLRRCVTLKVKNELRTAQRGPDRRVTITTQHPVKCDEESLDRYSRDETAELKPLTQRSSLSCKY